MADAVFPDTTVLCNFAAVNRLDLLEGFLRGRGRWSDAVAYEVGRSAAYLPALSTVVGRGWLGDPIEVDDERGVAAIEHLRRDVFGGTSVDSLRHLGEATTCFLLTEVAQWRSSWWVSDDRDALHYARGRGLITRESIDIVAGVVADGDLTAAAGFALMEAMHAAGRSLRMPRVPDDLRN